MFTDLYLRATDQAELDAALAAAGLLNDPRIAIDRIGQDPVRVIGMNPPANGEELPTPITQTIPGYHCNVRVPGALTDEQAAILAPVTIPPPNNPMRVWF